MAKRRTYFCIDMKTFYASVECAERGLNPFETNLAVTDVARGKNALCLAITPKMKAMGIRNRCRLSEIPKGVDYIKAMPRMRKYIEYAADIYAIYLDYFDKNDIYVYSIDEAFIDVTDYLKIYGGDEKALAKKLMNEIAYKKHIPSTAGIGTNLYLAKVALDITAKHAKDHMGYLDEEGYINTLWHHKPITDFWQIAGGKAKRLAKYGFFDMAAVAHAPEKILYKEFGIDAELLIDHAWGREPCLIEDIKNYKSKARSVSSSQILYRGYSFEEAKVVLKEMIAEGCREMMRRHVIAKSVGVFFGYESSMLPSGGGMMKMPVTTNLNTLIRPYALDLFEKHADKNALIRRLGVNFDVCDEGCEGYDLFTDFEQVEKEKKRERAVIDIKSKHGKNAILLGTDYLDCATQRERNTFIGGHKAGYDDACRKS